MKKQKNNKYASLNLPQAELDFHNRGILTEQGIIKITETFIKECKDNNIKKALIITGKGLHSENGIAKIKPIVEKYLRSHKDVKSAFESRRDRGGSGAIEVTLQN